MEFTPDDKNRLFMTLEAHTEQMKEQTVILKGQDEKLDSLERGMYGDKKLKIDGLINDVNMLKLWKENLKLKIAFFTGAVLTIYELIKEFIINHITNKGN